VFIEALASGGAEEEVLASINYSWEDLKFHEKRMRNSPGGAAEVVVGALDPRNKQSQHSQALLTLFQTQIKGSDYNARLKRNNQLFLEEVQRRE
jgi:hypothetical protein